MPKEKSPTASKKNLWGNPLHHPILRKITPKGEPLWPGESCTSAYQSQQILNVLTPLLWHIISKTKPAPTWKIASSEDRASSYLYLSLPNPLLSLLDNHTWFRLQTFITEDEIWQGRLSKSERKAITLHTMLNCPATHPPLKTASIDNLDTLIARLIVERKQREKQDKLLKDVEKTRSEKKTYCWWENLPSEISTLFINWRNQLTLSPEKSCIIRFLSSLQSTTNPKTTLGPLLCQGNNILLVISNPILLPIQDICLNIARKHKLIYQISSMTLQQAKIDCSAITLTSTPKKESTTPSLKTHSENLANQVTLFASPEQQVLLIQLLAYCQPSPLCETAYKLTPHARTENWVLEHDSFPHPLAVDDNLLTLLHRRRSLQRTLLSLENQTDITHLPSITLILPKLDKPHTLYPIEKVDFRITLYGSPTTTKSLLIKTFASLKDLVLPHSQFDWVMCLHYWPEYLDDIEPHVADNATAYDDYLLVKELLPQLLYRHPICKKTRIRLPQCLESAWAITNQLLQYPKNTLKLNNDSQHHHYPTHTLSPHRRVLQELLNENPPLRVTPLTSEPGSILLTNEEQQLLRNYQLPQPTVSEHTDDQTKVTPPTIFATEDWYHTPENSFSSVLTSDSDEDSLHDPSLSYEYSHSDDATWKSVPGVDEYTTIMADYFNQNTLIVEISQQHILSVTRNPSPQKRTNLIDKQSFFVSHDHKPQATNRVSQPPFTNSK